MFGTVSKWIGVYNIWYYGVFMALNGKQGCFIFYPKYNYRLLIMVLLLKFGQLDLKNMASIIYYACMHNYV